MSNARIEVDRYIVGRGHDAIANVEDGELYLRAVWNLEVWSGNDRSWVWPLSFRSEEEAQAWGEWVLSYGSINPDKWNRHVVPSNEEFHLPEWATPEFAQWERENDWLYH